MHILEIRANCGCLVLGCGGCPLCSLLDLGVVEGSRPQFVWQSPLMLMVLSHLLRVLFEDFVACDFEYRSSSCLGGLSSSLLLCLPLGWSLLWVGVVVDLMVCCLSDSYAS